MLTKEFADDDRICVRQSDENDRNRIEKWKLNENGSRCGIGDWRELERIWRAMEFEKKDTNSNINYNNRCEVHSASKQQQNYLGWVQPCSHATNVQCMRKMKRVNKHRNLNKKWQRTAEKMIGKKLPNVEWKLVRALQSKQAEYGPTAIIIKMAIAKDGSSSSKTKTKKTWHKHT